MRLTIDTEKQILEVDNEGTTRNLPLHSTEAFELISDQWLKVGWNQKYPYTLSWMGRPVIQLPEDLIRTQEALYRIKPDVVLETGIAHGGSLIFYASLCKIMGKGRVVGVDIDIRPHNRSAIEHHELFPYLTLIEGSSIDPQIIHQVKTLIKPGETVLVILDSCHSKSHVMSELNAYHDIVSPGSYIVATDGSMKDLTDVPRGKAEWSWDNPTNAATEFLQSHSEFMLEQPPWTFNESELHTNITHWPGAWLRRRS